MCDGFAVRCPTLLLSRCDSLAGGCAELPSPARRLVAVAGFCPIAKPAPNFLNLLFDATSLGFKTLKRCLE
jgi:hypothetical protein